MIDWMTIRFWMGATVAWLLFCILVFDRWYFFSPLGLALTFGLPAAGWFSWWRYAPAESRALSAGEQRVLDTAAELLQRLKNRFVREP